MVTFTGTQRLFAEQDKGPKPGCRGDSHGGNLVLSRDCSERCKMGGREGDMVNKYIKAMTECILRRNENMLIGSKFVPYYWYYNEARLDRCTASCMEPFKTGSCVRRPVNTALTTSKAFKINTTE